MSNKKTASVTRNFTVAYIAGLTLIALFFVIANLLIQEFHHTHTANALQINLAGRQRMLSQKFSKEIILLVASENLKTGNNLFNEAKKTLDTLSKNHIGLQYGDEMLGLPTTTDAKALKFFKEMEPHYQQIIHEGENALSMGPAGLSSLSVDSSSIREILLSATSYMTVVDRLLDYYGVVERQHKEKEVLYTELALAAILLLVLLEALFLFRPLINKINKANENLERKVEERTAELTALNKNLTREVSDRLNAENALRENEEFLHTVLQNLGEGILVLDRDFKIQMANRHLRNVMKMEEREVIGKQCYKLIHRREDICPDCATVNTFQTGKPGFARHSGVAKDGSVTHVELYTYPMFDSDGTVANVIEKVVDVTERKKAEEALRESEERFRTLFESAPVGMSKTGLDGKILRANQALCEILGYSKKELQTMKFTDVTHPDSLESDIKALAKLVSGEIKTYKTEKKYIHKGGDIVWASLSVAPISDPHGKPIFLTAQMVDITEKKKMEGELSKSQKLESIALLAGGIAHDFNNILQGILGNISVAKIHLEEGSKSHELLGNAERATMRATSLTQQLLTFSKGGAPVKRKSDIKELIRDTTNFALQGSDSRCKFEMAENLYSVEIDEGQISQVINNLIINADQAMPKGGIVDVAVCNITVKKKYHLPIPSGKYVKIALIDQGVGMSAEQLEKIFDPYFTTKVDGTGLGLSTSYSIIKNHKGHIEVKSEPGKGARFHIYLPASETIETAEKENVALIKGNGRVLVMDDEKNVRETLEAMLIALGYEACLTKNGEDAVETYKNAMESAKPFDAVILDLTVPGGMGGRMAVMELKKIDPNVKAIVSSGYSNDPVMADHKKYSFAGIMSKPYIAEKLGSILQSTINS